MNNKLGSFVREFQYEGATFYVRGLTVAEYTDLIEQDVSSFTNRFYIEVGIASIIGWEELHYKSDDGRFVELDFEEGRQEWLDEKTLTEVGKYSYHNLTQLSPEDSDKFSKYIQFIYWTSDANESRVDSFDCETCLKRGLAKVRPCGKFSDEQIMAMHKELNNQEDGAAPEDQKPQKNLKNKYSSKSRKRYTHKSEFEQDQGIEQDSVNQKKRLKLGNFTFDECPISYVDPWIKVMGEAMYHAEKSDQTLFSGGVLDQPHKLWRASKVVRSQFNTIEQEEMDKQKNKTSKKSRNRKKF